MSDSEPWPADGLLQVVPQVVLAAADCFQASFEPHSAARTPLRGGNAAQGRRPPPGRPGPELPLWIRSQRHLHCTKVDCADS